MGAVDTDAVPLSLAQAPGIQADEPGTIGVLDHPFAVVEIMGPAGGIDDFIHWEGPFRCLHIPAHLLLSGVLPQGHRPFGHWIPVIQENQGEFPFFDQQGVVMGLRSLAYFPSDSGLCRGLRCLLRLLAVPTAFQGESHSQHQDQEERHPKPVPSISAFGKRHDIFPWSPPFLQPVTDAGRTGPKRTRSDRCPVSPDTSYSSVR